MFRRNGHENCDGVAHQRFDKQRDPLTYPDAKRSHTLLSAPRFHRPKQRADDPGTARTDRVSQGNGAPVNVYVLEIQI